MESTLSEVGNHITIYVADIRHEILPPGHQPQFPLTQSFATFLSYPGFPRKQPKAKLTRLHYVGMTDEIIGHMTELSL